MSGFTKLPMANESEAAGVNLGLVTFYEIGKAGGVLHFIGGTQRPVTTAQATAIMQAIEKESGATGEPPAAK